MVTLLLSTMASNLCKVFSVIRQQPELIVPASPTPHEVKQLSAIDNQEIQRFQLPLIWFYKNELSINVKGRDPVELIKAALSRALVFYYPLAGRVIKFKGSNRKLAMDCTGEGVLFIEADANFKLEELGEEIRTPCPYLDQLLYNVPGSVDILGCPVLLFQVTRLRCGGFVLAIRFNHAVCDGFGMVQFLTAIEEMVGGACKPSILPIWQREFLNPIDPSRTYTHPEYEETEINNTIVRTRTPTYMNKLDHKSFYFGSAEMKALRTYLPLYLKNSCSNFELISACIWKCRTYALALDPDDIVQLSCVYDIRGRHYTTNPPLGYYGNAILLPSECTTVDYLCKMTLGYVVELVKKAKSKMNEEFVQSLIDCMLTRRQPTFDSNRNFIVSDNTRLGFDELDFGWGKPVFAGVAKATPLISFLIKHVNYAGEYGILVPICLPNSTMERFRKELHKMIQGPVKKVDLCSKI